MSALPVGRSADTTAPPAADAAAPGRASVAHAPVPANIVPADIVRARRNLLGLYFLTGIAVATWLARLPSIRSALDLTTGGLGTVLVVGSIGSLLMVVVAGGLTNRFGSGRALLAAAVLFSVANVLVGVGPTIGSLPVLATGMLISSSSYALANVPLNLETVVIERAMGRPVVPQFHAAFSIGSVTGALLGAGVVARGSPCCGTSSDSARSPSCGATSPFRAPSCRTSRGRRSSPRRTTPKTTAATASVSRNPSTTAMVSQLFAEPSERAAARTITPMMRVRGSRQAARATRMLAPRRAVGRPSGVVRVREVRQDGARDGEVPPHERDRAEPDEVPQHGDAEPRDAGPEEGPDDAADGERGVELRHDGPAHGALDDDGLEVERHVGQCVGGARDEHAGREHGQAADGRADADEHVRGGEQHGRGEQGRSRSRTGWSGRPRPPP